MYPEDQEANKHKYQAIIDSRKNKTSKKQQM